MDQKNNMLKPDVAESNSQSLQYSLEILDAINSTIAQTAKIDEMLPQLLDQLLQIFETDRAWLIYPCDPGVSECSVAMERTKPEFPGAGVAGRPLPVDDFIRRSFEGSLQTRHSITIGRGNDVDFPADWPGRERFSIRSQIMMCIRPAEDQPWLFGLQQCSFERHWTTLERQLFESIGNRVGDALSRMRVIKALQDSEEKYRHLVESSSDWIWEMDSEWRYTYCSPRVADILGYSPEEMLGKTTFDLIPPQERERVSAIFKDIAAQKRSIVRLVNLYRHKDGSDRFVETSGEAIVLQGELLGYRGIDRDITARTLAEQSVKEKEEWIRSIFSVESIAFLVVKFDNKRATFIDFSPGAEKLFGYRRDEVIGQSVIMLHLSENADRLQEITALLLQGKKVEIEEIQYRQKSGNTFVGMLSIHPLKGPTGRIAGAVGLCMNISERKEMEDRLRQAQKMEAIGQLAGGIAHDFNNQLAGICGYADLIRDLSRDRPTITQYADGILLGVNHASNLTGQLLAFARKGRYQSVSVNVHKTLTDVVDILSRTIDKRIQIRQLFEARIPFVKGDPSQLQSMLLNLGLNARDAMPNGGNLTLITDLAERDLAYCRRHSSAIKPGWYLQISVADTGVGMDEKTASRIFEPFFTTKPQGKGTGMGLAAVYGTVKSHGGTITVESQLGRSTTFTIELPVDEAPRTVDKVETRATKSSGNRTILVVDDEPAVRKMAQALLSSLGYKVETCSNGKQAVELYPKKKSEIDIVLLDMAMPELNGRDTFMALKQLDPNIKVILVSGYSIDGETQEILDAGALGFIQKPFRRNALAQKIESALSASSISG